jgi:hypothetical protein
MANIFPRTFNFLPIKIFVGLIIIANLVVAGVWYYFTPKYTRVGYMPTQPVPFDHSIHVKQLGMDCRYCHSFVETSNHSNVPTTQTCMNCHNSVQKDNPKLAALRASWDSAKDKKDGQSVEWIKIHRAPDFVYFNHSVHVNRGVSCVSCHGQVNEMQVVYHHEPQSMGWCLDCHRAPQNHVRPMDKGQVFNLDWKPQDEGTTQQEIGEKLVKEWNINPPQNCAGCHR